MGVILTTYYNWDDPPSGRLNRSAIFLQPSFPRTTTTAATQQKRREHAHAKLLQRAVRGEIWALILPRTMYISLDEWLILMVYFIFNYID